jgi:hypothetical protein
MKVKTGAGRRQATARAIRFIMIAADTKTAEEFEKARRTVSEDDREFSVRIADNLIDLVDALLQPVLEALEKLDKPAHLIKLDGKEIARAISEGDKPIPADFPRA